MADPGKCTLLILLLLGGCTETAPPSRSNKRPNRRSILVDPYLKLRETMVERQMRDVTDPQVLQAMGNVPRHLFVPPDMVDQAYQDRPLGIGYKQTISQPYIVALMTQAAGVSRGDKVLEVGTGSGYQAAILAEMGCPVWSIEIVEELYRFSRENLKKAGYGELVQQKCGDGYGGWPAEAPFDVIIVTAAPKQVPAPLKEQLKVGGRLVIPVGGFGSQQLTVITRQENGFSERSLIPVRFVPFVRKK